MLWCSYQVYFIDNNLFRYVGSVDILEAVIEHGSIKNVTVNEGLLGKNKETWMPNTCGRNL